MYDFCLTYPYAFILGIGGLVGFLVKGSKASLVAGSVSCGVLYLLAYVSKYYFNKGQLCKTATFLSLVVTGGVTFAMYQRFVETQKVFPAGVTVVLSGFMAIFYVWSLLCGPVPKKHQESKAKRES